MELVNTIGIDSPNGFRTFQLYKGSLTEREVKADVLVVSVIEGDYTKTTTSLVGALHRDLGIDLAKLSREYILNCFHLWISRPLGHGQFGRVMCLEFPRAAVPIASLVDDVFVGLAVLEAKGVKVRSVAMPVLGAGDQRFDPGEIISALIPKTREAMERSRTLSRILFVEQDSARLQALDEAINSFLGRSAVKVSRPELISSIVAPLLSLLAAAEGSVQQRHRELFGDANRILSSAKRPSFEIGVLGRRLAEFVTSELLRRPNPPDTLEQKIRELKDNVPACVSSCFYNLKAFGNENAHENRKEEHVLQVVEDDLVICLLCIRRALEYWIASREAGPTI